MDYQELKQRRDSIVTEFHDSNLQNIDILYVEDYDKLLNFIDEYESLTRLMLQHIWELEISVTKKDDLEDRKWLEHFLSLGE